MIICGKSSCSHCEKIFDFKNKLHDHIRNKKCQQSLIKSKSVNKTDFTLFFIFEKSVISDDISNTRLAAISFFAA